MDLSVVIPVYNEAENAEPMHHEVHAALRETGLDYEVIFVDDGSVDDTFAILERLAADEPRTMLVRFRRNFGQTAAMSAGFDMASGDVVVTMDGDLQNDPRDIPKLLARLDEGYDIAAGWRYDRQDAFINRKLPSAIANGLISKITGVHLHDYGCTLKAFRREVVQNIRLYGEMHRFIPAIASLMGVKIIEVPVNHRARTAGRTKYGIGRTPRVLLDLITVKFLLSYSTKPIQIFGRWGLVSSFLGILLGLYYTVLKLFFSQPMWGKPGVILAVLLILVGVQLISIGLLGELQVRTYYETQQKPIYTVLKVVGGRPKDACND